MLTRLAAILFALFLAACGGAYAAAIAKGDQYAQAGQWDEAATAYEQAVKLNPNDPEAQIKLKQVRQKQSAQRLERALALERRGELAGALTLVQEAVKLAPESADAQRALTRVNDAVLDRADALYADDELREALELTTLVLGGSKNHPRARELDDRLRTALADRAFKKATAFLERDKLGNALVQLAACLTYRPDFPDAKLQFGQVKLRLEDELRYTVVLGAFAGRGPNAAITKALNPQLLQQSIDDRLLLTVVTQPPPAPRGVTLSGEFRDYGYRHDEDQIARHCDYQCGTDYIPNPRIQQLRSELASIDRQVSSDEREISRLQRDVLDAEKRLSQEESDLQKRQADADQARARLDKCRASADPEDSSPCSSEESNLRSKQSSVDSARRDVESARDRAQRERDDVMRATERRDQTRQRRDRTNQELLETPEKKPIPRMCDHEYAVDRHAVEAKVTMRLSLQELVDGEALVDDQPFQYDVRAADETFPAQAGRCAEVAGGNPLQLPSEEELRRELITKVIRDLRSKILTSYDAYRRGFLTAARRDEGAGLNEQATEAYVRYVLTGPHQLDDSAHLGDFFERTSGIGKLDALWEN